MVSHSRVTANQHYFMEGLKAIAILRGDKFLRLCSRSLLFSVCFKMFLQVNSE